MLVTNDDGINGPGLHVLVRRLREEHDGELIVVAPHTEQSGMGAAVGPFYLDPPLVHEASIPDAEADAVWSIEGPPALGVLVARLGAFGPPPDLVVSGINPGLNVGRAVYHSGTVGAALTARNGHINGIAISQDIDPTVSLHPQHWETAAEVAAVAMRAVADAPPATPSVLNLNVPDVPLGELRGARFVPVGDLPPRRAMSTELRPLGEGRHELVFEAASEAEDAKTLPPGLDTSIIGDGWAAMSWLGRIAHDDPGGHDVDARLAARFDGS
ncbi:MAG: 5'/3'-nucleotidase SurE [Actinomycetota bacterium]